MKSVTLISIDGNSSRVISVNDVQNKFHYNWSILAVCNSPMDDRNQSVVKVVYVEIRESLSIGPHLIANL